MFARFRNYFRRLGLFQSAIAALLMWRVILFYQMLWQAGHWQLCLTTIGLGLFVALVLWRWLVNPISRGERAIAYTFLILLSLICVQQFGNVQLPEWVALGSLVLMWFGWFAGFLVYSHPPLMLAEDLDLDWADDRTDLDEERRAGDDRDRDYRPRDFPLRDDDRH